MNTESIVSILNQCSSCLNTLLKNQSKLLPCLHGICKDCIVLQTTISGIQCNICESVTEYDELIEFPTISAEICRTTNCCQEASNICTICHDAFCQWCFVHHKRFDCNHRQTDFTPFEHEVIQCTNCIEMPGQVVCTKCSTINCASCYLKNHEGHGFSQLDKIYEDNRFAIISVKDELELNSRYIEISVGLTESHLSKLEDNYNVIKSAIEAQWKMVHEEMMNYKIKVTNAFEKLHQKRISDIYKNKSTLQKLKTKNNHCTNFVSSLLRHNMNFKDARLVKVIKDNQLNICISKNTPESLLNITPGFSISNFMKSSEEIIRVIKSVENVTSPPIVDLAGIFGVQMLTGNTNIEEQLILENLQMHIEDPHFDSGMIEKNSSSPRMTKYEESCMDVVHNQITDSGNELHTKKLQSLVDPIDERGILRSILRSGKRVSVLTTADNLENPNLFRMDGMNMNIMGTENLDSIQKVPDYDEVIEDKYVDLPPRKLCKSETETSDYSYDSGFNYLPSSQFVFENKYSDDEISLKSKINIDQCDIFKPSSSILNNELQDILDPKVTESSIRPEYNFCATVETSKRYPLNNKRALNKTSNYCMYCETNVSNFTRHMIRNHETEKEIVQYLSLEKGSKERQLLACQLRKRGEFLCNVGAEKVIKPVRKPNEFSETPLSTANYLPCMIEENSSSSRVTKYEESSIDVVHNQLTGYGIEIKKFTNTH